MMIEVILFSKENHDLWCIKDVPEALRRVKENEKKLHRKKDAESSRRGGSDCYRRRFIDD